MTGIQAVVFGTRLIAIDKRYSHAFADKVGIDELETFLDKPMQDTTSKVFWLLTAELSLIGSYVRKMARSPTTKCSWNHCMLTHYVEWHMRRALATLMYVEDDLPAARAARDPVAKSEPTAEARRKKRTSISKDGFPLQDWRGLMATLGTICRTTIAVGGIPATMDTEPTPHQMRIFTLLETKTFVWNWRRAQ